MAVIAKPPFPLRTAVSAVRPSSILTRALPTRSYNTFVATTGRTFQQAIALAADFEWVQLIYSTDAAGYSLTKAVLCSSAVFAVQPKTAAGVNPSWTSVTFDSAGADSSFPPASYPRTAASLSLTGSDVTNPVLGFSDWIKIRSEARTDGGSLPLLYIRTYFDSTNTATRICGSAPVAAWDASAVGKDRIWASWSGGNDSTTSDYTSAPPTRGAYSPVVGVRFLTRSQQGVTVMFGGDSITQGTTSSQELRSWGFLACVQATADLGMPISHVNAGWASQSSLSFYNRVVRGLDYFKPQILFFAPWTPNDVNTLAAAYDSWLRAMQIAEICRQKDIRPVLWTPIPSGLPTDVATEAPRQWVCSQVRSWEKQGNIIADIDAVVRDGNTPAHLIPSYTTDNLHLLNSGCEAVAPVVAAAIAKHIRA